MPSPSIQDALALFADQHLAARNLAPLTRSSYGSDLKQLARYLTEELGLERVDQMQPRYLQGFLVTLDRRGLRGASRRRKVATIRSLFRFLVQHGVLQASPAEELQPPEREREERRVLSEAEYKRLMAAAQHEVRDGPILALLLQPGIRQSEGAAIRLGDLQLPARVSRDAGSVGSLRVHGKRRKERIVTLN